MAFLARHQVPGVAMKANVWEFEDLETALRAGEEFKEGEWRGRWEGKVLEKVEEILASRGYKVGMEGHEVNGDAVLRP